MNNDAHVNGEDAVGAAPDSEGLGQVANISEEGQPAIVSSGTNRTLSRAGTTIGGVVLKVAQELFVEMARRCSLLPPRRQEDPTADAGRHVMDRNIVLCMSTPALTMSLPPPPTPPPRPPSPLPSEEATGTCYVPNIKAVDILRVYHDLPLPLAQEPGAAKVLSGISSMTCEPVSGYARRMGLHLEAVAITARRRENDRVPILRLPETVLRDIFLIVIQPLTQLSVKTALELSHVCYYMRHAALAEARLWASICTRFSPRFLALCLERSKQTYLNAIVHAQNAVKTARILGEFSRMRILILILDDPSKVPTLPTRHCLRQLTIGFKLDATTFETPLDNHSLEELDHLQTRDAPLSVLGSFIRPRLQVVIVKNERPQLDTLDLPSLLTLLAPLPLRTLRLIYALPRFPTRTPQVDLRRLDTLHLTDVIHPIVPFLQSVCLPELKSLLVRVTSSASDADIDNVASAIKSLLLCRTNKNMALRTAVMDRPGSLRYRAWPGEIDVYGESCAPTPTLEVIFYCPPTNDIEMAHKIVSSFRSDQLSTYVVFHAKWLDKRTAWSLHRTPGFRLLQKESMMYIARFDGYDRHPEVLLVKLPNDLSLVDLLVAS